MLQRDFNQPGDSSSQSTIPDLFPDFERLLQTKIEVSPPRPIPLRAPQPPRLWKLEIKSNEAGGYNASLEFEDGTKVEDTTVSPDPSLFEVRAWLDRYRESFGETAGAATRVEVAQKLRAAGEKMLPLLFPPRLDAEFTARFQNRPAQIHLSLPREWESIPWEYLADEEGYYLPQVPLYFSRAVKIETKPSRRGGTLPPTSELPALALPLRLLIVVSSPLDLNEDMQLDSDREVRQIRNALAEAIRQGEVVLELEDEANRERLKETLTRFKPHILHFSGHGYNTAQGLVWEGADGNTKRKDAPTAENPHQKVADPLDASAFADLLREQPQLRLLVLSACRSAERGTGGAFESVAEGLISRGVAPAVVAMQDSILDESGILFARHFYTNLSLGKAVEVALAEARREMEASGPDGQRGLEWGLPNHLTNRPGAALFSFDRLESFTPEVKRKGFNLVKLGNYFVGRQPELRKGRAALVGDQKRVVIITGPGGFGKSALAEKLLERTDYAFKTVFGVDCKRWQGLDIFLTTIATGLAEEGYHQLLIETLKKEQSLENKINALVEALNAGPHLLLLDNFEDLLNLNQDPYRPGGAKAEQYSEAVNLEGFLLELHKGLERGKLLITCRYDFEFTPQDRGAKEIEWLPLKKLSWREAEKIMLSNELGQLGRAQRRELYDKGAQSPIMFDWLAKEAASGKLAALIAEMTRLNQKFSDEFLLENLYQQLDPRGQALLRRGAVYRKAVPEEFWSRQQSKANLQPLLRRSLIYSEGEAYQLHESVRQFALNKLNENQAEFREAHLQAGQHFQYYAQNTEYNFLDLLEAKDHYLAAKAFPDAAELIQDLFPALDRAGLWRFTLGLLEELEHKLAESRADLPSNLAAWQLIYRGLLLNDLAGASKAIPLYEAALLLAREAGNIQTEAAVLGNLGNAYSSLGDYPKAIEYQEKRLGIAKEIGDRLGEGQVYGNLGVAYLSLGDYPKAIEYHQKSLKIKLEIGDRRGEGAAYGNLGNAYSSLGDYPKAIEYQEKSLKIAQEIGDRLGEGQAYGNLGNAYDILGDYPKAIEYHGQHLGIAKEIGDRLGKGAAYGNLGVVYLSLGDYPKAIGYQEKSLKIKLEIGDREGEGAAYGNLGNAYFSLGDYPKAIEYHQKALEIDLEIGSKLGVGQDYGNLGVAYLSLGDYPKAIEYQENSLKIKLEIGDRQGEGAAYGNLGVAYDSLGDYPKAIEYQEKRLGIAKEIGDRLGEGQVYGNLGVAYLSLGDYPKAIENGVRSSLIMLQIQSPHIRQVLNILKKVRGKIGLGELERVAAEVCGRLGVEYAQYRQLLEQGGVFAENSGQPGRLNEQLQGVAKTIGFALSGNEVALKNLTEQILPQLERMESGFEKLADFLHRLLAREIAPEAFQEELGALAETDRAIIALAFETARKATNEAESGDKQTENPGKDGLSEPHQQLALTIGQALRGNQEARKLLEQLLPQMENEESGFANLAGLVRLFLAGEQDQTKLQAAAANLDDTDRAIIQLAIQTAQGQADPPPSPSSREAEPQEQVVEQFISLLIAAAGGNEEAREQVQPVLDTMAEDKNTRKLAARLEMLLEGERNPESLTRGLSENENALIRAILEKLD